MSIQIAEATISLEPSGVTAQGFSDILFASRHNFWEERVKVFTSTADAIAAGVPTSHPIYKAVEGAFIQNPAPSRIKIGRFESTSVISLEDEVEGKSYGLSLEAKDAADSLVVTHTLGTGETAFDALTALKTAIDGEADITAKVTTTIQGTGSDATLELSHAVAGDWFIVKDLVNVAESFLATPENTAAVEMASIRSIDDDYYWLTSDVKDSVFVQGLADHASTVFGKYVVSLAEADAYSAALTGTFKVLLEDKQSSDVYAFYDHKADEYTEVNFIAESLFAKTGRITYANRIVAGAEAAKRADGTNLDSTELANLKANKVNYFDKVGLIGSLRRQRTNPAITVGGKVASGELLQTMVGLDAMSVAIQEVNTNLLLRLKNNRLAYDRTSFELVRGELNKVLSDFADPSSHYFIYPKNDLEFGYEINIPSPYSISSADKIENVLKDVTFTATLRGAIHFIKVTGSLG